jgi:hypothetical protein
MACRLGAAALVCGFGLSAFAADVVSGKVADMEGKPVADARVLVCRHVDGSPTMWRMLAEGRSGEDGAFRIALPVEAPPGSELYAVRAYKEGLSWGGAYYTPGWKREVKITLDKPASVSGRVTDQKGAPIAGAQVSLTASKTGPNNRHLKVFSLRGLPGSDSLVRETDMDGAFIIRDLPDGAKCFFHVEAEGYATFDSEHGIGENSTFTIPAKDVAIALPPESRIRGILKCEKDGALVAGIRLLFSSGNSFAYAEPTDAQGRFDARGLAAGDYCVEAISSADKDLGGVVALQTVHVNEGDTVENIPLIWTEGAVLEGKILNQETNEPLAGVTIYLSPWGGPNPFGEGTTSTDSGSYRIRVLPGAYVISISKIDFDTQSEQTITLTTGSQKRDFTLEPEVLTKVTVLDEAGKPLAKASILRSMVMTVATTDAKGQASVSLGSPARGVFERMCVVSAAGDLAAPLEPPAEGIREVTVTLRKAAALTGLVRKPDGCPLADATVKAMWNQDNASGPAGSPVKTDGDGRYRISGLIGGSSYTIYAQAKGYGSNWYPGMKPVTAGSGETVEMEPVMLQAAAAILTGHVTDATGAPLEGVTIFAGGELNEAKATTTDKDGRFKFENLVPERVTLNVSYLNGRHVFNRNVTPAEFADLKIVVYPEFDANRQMAANAPAPELKELDWIQGEWKGFAGKCTVVAFVSTKNRPSRAVIKEIQVAVSGAKDGSLQAALVHDATATADEIKEFLAKNQVTLPVGRVKSEEDYGLYTPAFTAYKVNGTPTIIIVNAQGRIEAANVSPSELSVKLTGQPR